MRGHIQHYSKRIFLQSTDSYVVFLYIILGTAFLVRLINLNYNSAFNDEAIYVVVGRLGLFAEDWWSYGAKLWMAGLPYIYPTLTALAYHAGGILGSRLLNVIFGVLLIEEVYRFVTLLNLFDEKRNKVAALIAAFIVAFSGIGIFVSRLATYDMPSFLLLMVGINSFLKAEHFSNGKYYAISFITLFFAFLTKIVIAAFFPLLFLFSYLILRSRSSTQKKKAIFYLYIPLAIAFLLYTMLYIDNIFSYISSQHSLGKTDSLLHLGSVVWANAREVLLLTVPSAIIFIVVRKVKPLISLLLFASVVPIFHVATMRYATFDKHMYLTIVFLAVIVGYGISLALFHKNNTIERVTRLALPVFLMFYIVGSYAVLQNRQDDWPNTVPVERYLRYNVQTGEKVLTQDGGAIVLSLYEKIFPPENIVTFDWIDYSGMTGERAYLLAIQDEYFDYIELNTLNLGIKSEALRAKILANIQEDYVLAYQTNTFEIYEKKDK